MRRPSRSHTLAAVALAALAGSGIATAAALRTIHLKPGHCTRVAKTRVCADKKIVTRRRTVTVAVTTIPELVTVTAPAPPPAVAFRDGTFRVGIDIQPGTYRASTPSSCYWDRLRGFSGGLGDIIANAVDTGIVTILPTDVGFDSQGCGSWTKIG